MAKNHHHASDMRKNPRLILGSTVWVDPYRDLNPSSLDPGLVFYHRNLSPQSRRIPHGYCRWSDHFLNWRWDEIDRVRVTMVPVEVPRPSHSHKYCEDRQTLSLKKKHEELIQLLESQVVVVHFHFGRKYVVRIMMMMLDSKINPRRLYSPQ